MVQSRLVDLVDGDRLRGQYGWSPSRVAMSTARANFANHHHIKQLPTQSPHPAINHLKHSSPRPVSYSVTCIPALLSSASSPSPPSRAPQPDPPKRPPSNCQPSPPPRTTTHQSIPKPCARKSSQPTMEQKREPVSRAARGNKVRAEVGLRNASGKRRAPSLADGPVKSGARAGVGDVIGGGRRAGGWLWGNQGRRHAPAPAPAPCTRSRSPAPSPPCTGLELTANATERDCTHSTWTDWGSSRRC